eukprot:1156119-Pelagomonas_calceolata.AAC.12
MQFAALSMLHRSHSRKDEPHSRAALVPVRLLSYQALPLADKGPSEVKGGREGGGTRVQGSILQPVRTDQGVRAFKNNMLFFLHIILGITKITNRRNGVIPCCLLNFESMVQSGHAANNVLS